MPTMYCHAEPGRFPDTEFVRDKDGQLVVPYIHNIGIPHYSTGDPLFPGSDPSTAGLMARICGLVLKMPQSDLQSVIDRLTAKQ